MGALTHEHRKDVPKLAMNMGVVAIVLVAIAMAWTMTAVAHSGLALLGWLLGATVFGAIGWLVSGHWVTTAQMRILIGLVSSTLLLAFRISAGAMGLA